MSVRARWLATWRPGALSASDPKNHVPLRRRARPRATSARPAATRPACAPWPAVRRPRAAASAATRAAACPKRRPPPPAARPPAARCAPMRAEAAGQGGHGQNAARASWTAAARAAARTCRMGAPPLAGRLRGAARRRLRSRADPRRHCGSAGAARTGPCRAPLRGRPGWPRSSPRRMRGGRYASRAAHLRRQACGWAAAAPPRACCKRGSVAAWLQEAGPCWCTGSGGGARA